MSSAPRVSVSCALPPEAIALLAIVARAGGGYRTSLPPAKKTGMMRHKTIFVDFKDATMQRLAGIPRVKALAEKHGIKMVGLVSVDAKIFGQLIAIGNASRLMIAERKSFNRPFSVLAKKHAGVPGNPRKHG